MNCSSLTGVQLDSQAPPLLGSYAFDWSPVQAFYIPNGRHFAYNEDASWAVNKTKIFSLDWNITIDSNGFALTSSGRHLIHYLGTGGDIVVPDTVSIINEYAFTMNKNITSVTMTGSFDDAASIGSYAFSGCEKLTCLVFNSLSVPEISSYIIDNSPVKVIYVPTGKESVYKAVTANGWDSGKVYEIGKLNNNFLIENYNLIHYFGSSATVTVPAGVKDIGVNAFMGRTCITTINLPASVESINVSAFNHCPNITSFTVNAANTKYAVYNGALYTKDFKQLIKYPAGNSAATYAIHNDTEKIGEYAFARANKLTNISISNCVNIIGQYAFYECRNLSSLTMGSNVSIIESYAFGSCDKLNAVNFGEGIIEIRNRAFDNCIRLESIELPDSLTSIGAYAFNNLRSLKNVTIGGGIVAINEYAFFNCIRLETVTIGNPAVPALFANVFKYNKSGMGYIIIPDIIIYVPEASVSAYKSANNWNEYEDNILSVGLAE